MTQRKKTQSRLTAVRVAHATRDGHTHMVLYTEETCNEMRRLIGGQIHAGEIPIKTAADLFGAMFEESFKGQKRKS